MLTSKVKAGTEALFRVNHAIIEHKKLFQDGKMLKEAFVKAAESLFWDLKTNCRYYLQSKHLSYQEAQLHCIVNYWPKIWHGNFGRTSRTVSVSGCNWSTASRCCMIVHFYLDDVYRYDCKRWAVNNMKTHMRVFQKTLWSKPGCRYANWCSSPRIVLLQWLAPWMDLLPGAERTRLSPTSLITTV